MRASRLENTRLDLSASVDRDKKNALGQFLTPHAIAQFMASLFHLVDNSEAKILDAGAGIGSLTGALLDRIIEFDIRKSEVFAFEFDNEILPHLQQTLKEYSAKFSKLKKQLKAHLLHQDYIEYSSLNFISDWHTPFDFAILNPPYGKINSNSRYRSILRESGIETVNLYTAFVALAVKQLAFGGQLVAIIPRSFCNGPYYKPFRELILGNASLEYIHLFDSRKKAFKEDGVLQENIIIHLIKGKKQSQKVIISTSHDIDFSRIQKKKFPFRQIVSPLDVDKFIHIPNENVDVQSIAPKHIDCSLEKLGVNVSTGPVVDFRMKEYLLKEPSKSSVPLLYPAHFNGWKIKYPVPNFKKYNALALNEVTSRWLYPNGFYTVVRRFSSKEEKRRVVACVLRPEDIKTKLVGLENHLNVFHVNRKGLSEEMAYGLAAYLNSKYVDNVFRTFSGHTQVNVTDLRKIKYPNKRALLILGKWAMSQKVFDYMAIDKKVEKLL